jgi:hypothetical protein
MDLQPLIADLLSSRQGSYGELVVMRINETAKQPLRVVSTSVFSVRCPVRNAQKRR